MIGGLLPRLSGLLEQAPWHTDLGAWVVLSFALYVVAAWVGWFLGRLQRRHPEGRLARWERRGFTRAALYAACVAYGFGIPYAALLRGVASPRLLGLTGWDWVQSLGPGSALAGLALVILVVGWWGYRRRVPISASPVSWPLTVLEVAAWQMHWALYRSAAVAWLHDAYVGVWAGLLLVVLEAALAPFTWQALASPREAEGILRPAAFAFSSAVLFYFARNLWLCLAFHAVGELALTRWLPLPDGALRGEPLVGPASTDDEG